MKAAVINKSDSATGFYMAAVMILLIRICSYFMLSEDVAVTQALKICMRMFVTAASAIMLFRLSEKIQHRSSVSEPLSLALYMAYLSLGVASLAWTSSFGDSMLHLLMDMETLLFCYLYIKLLLEARNTFERKIRISKVAAITIFLITAGFLAGLLIHPEKFYRFTHGGEEARLGGFIINPNELGMLLVIGIGTAIIELKHSYNKWTKWLMMIIMVYALMLTGSRSSMIGLMLIIIYFISQSKTMRMKLVIILALLASVPFITNEIFIKQGNLEEVLSMTGRIPFWQDLLSINFQREPLLGYGYMRIDYTDKFESINSYAGAMTHNTFLQVLMGLGLTGLFIVIAQLSATVYAVIRCADERLKRLSIAMLIPVVVNSFTEFGIFGETNYGIMFYLFIIFSVSLKPRTQNLRTSGIHAKGAGTLLRSSAAA